MSREDDALSLGLHVHGNDSRDRATVSTCWSQNHEISVEAEPVLSVLLTTSSH